MTEAPETFKREERYIVIKRKHLTGAYEADMRAYLTKIGVGIVDCAVVEHDWPEYETVWQMIEARCGASHGATINQSSIVGATVKNCLATEPVSLPYKFGDGDVHTCWACGALPCDGGLQAWERLPWVVTMKESGGWRFLIDSRDPDDRDMFSGFKINAHGKIGEKSLTTGEGGRYNYHRSYFFEELPE